MWKIEKPTFKVDEVFIECISNYRDNTKNRYLKTRLNSYQSEIEHFSCVYENHALDKTFYKLPPDMLITNNEAIVTSEEMKKVYEEKLSRRGQPGRAFYDKIVVSAKKKCPLCGKVGINNLELDHHLPKSEYPTLSVTPSNLVPSCSICNKLKLAKSPKKTDTETIHPYFLDNKKEENSQWLYSKVVPDENEIPTLIFFVKSNPKWDRPTVARIENHFSVFNLAETYNTLAISDLVDNLGVWVAMYNEAVERFDSKFATEILKDHLTNCANSYKLINLNYWKFATYEALSKSKWFCSEGFKNLINIP